MTLLICDFLNCNAILALVCGLLNNQAVCYIALSC